MVETTQKNVEATTEEVLTKNGALTNATSLDSNVDLFFAIGASRNMDVEDIQPLFEKALNEEPEVAVRILLWTRDARGGAGERRAFRHLMEYALNYLAGDETRIMNFLEKTVEVGRWDDLVATFFNTKFERYALRLIRKGLLEDENGLCAKWMERPKKSKTAKKICAYLGMSPKEYRKLLVKLSNTVEQKMCANDWDNINYEHVPSLATARYTSAFMRHDEDRFRGYLADVNSGDAKINAGAVYPYDVVKNMKQGNAEAADAQWNALPNYCEGMDGNIIPVVDTSGSMGCQVGDNKNLSCLDVAVSLGLYLSERLEGRFKDRFITFSDNPTMQSTKGVTLSERYNKMRTSQWDMSTNLQAVFEMLLDEAVRYNVSEASLPSTILILSDMEFNATTTGWSQSVKGYDTTNMMVIEQKYADAGYNVPNIVWWNLNARAGNVPVEHDKLGTAMVSGFSPSIMKTLLAGEDITPRSVMLDTVMVDRYTV